MTINRIASGMATTNSIESNDRLNGIRLVCRDQAA